MQRKRTIAALFAAGLVLTAAGCGGDDEGGDTTTAATDTTSATDTTVGSATTAASQTTAGGEVDTSDWPDKIVLGLVPSREADVLVENAAPLTEALSEALGIEVEGFVPQDYTALVEAMGSGQADIGAFGPFALLQAQDRYGVNIVLQSERFGSPTYHTQFMTNDPDTYCTDEPVADDDGYLYCNGTLDADTGPVALDSLGALAGVDISYVEQNSASGYIFPALDLVNAGISLDDVNEHAVYTGGHDASVLSVYNGDTAVGVAFDDARTAIAEEFADVGEKVVVFAYSEEIPNDGWAVRSELPETLQTAITDALVAYAGSPEGAETLNSIYEIDNLVPADLASFDVVRDAAEQLGVTSD